MLPRRGLEGAEVRAQTPIEEIVVVVEVVQPLHWQHCDYKRGESTEGDSGNDPGAGAEADPIHAKLPQPRYPSLPAAKKNTFVFTNANINTNIQRRLQSQLLTWVDYDRTWVR